jgi:uncharacterized OB-fold protein
MADVTALLQRVWDHKRPPAGAYVECRDCGTTLSSDASKCRACGSAALARYVLSDASETP